MAQYLQFDGINDEVTFPDVLAGAATFTINLDVNIKAAPLGFNSLLSNNNASGANFRNMIFTTSNRAMEVACIIGDVRRAFLTSNGIFNFNQRMMVQLQYDGSTLVLRIDGVVRGSIAATGVLNTISSVGDRGFTRLGQNASLGFPNIDLYGLEFIGNGSVARFYNPSSSSGTSLVDTSVNAINGTILGGASFVYYNSITALPIPNNTLGAALNQPCAINLNNYFTGATSYSVLSGSLPAGLSISGNQIVGTPTAAQSTQFVIRAANSIDTLDSATITFNTGLWFLNNASSNTALITIPNVTIGATVGDYIEIRAVANAGNTGGAYRLCSANNAGFQNLIELSTSSITFRANDVRNTITAGYVQPPVGSIFTLRATKASSTTWQLTLNGSNLGSPFTNNGNLLVGILFAVQGATTNEAFRGGIYHVDISTNGGASATRYYDPSASGGVGNLLIDRVSNQNGTQTGTWPADNSEFVSSNPISVSNYPQQLQYARGYPVTINLNNHFVGATSYSIASGSLPVGLTLSGHLITGTPTANGESNFVIRAHNGAHTLDTGVLRFTVAQWYLKWPADSGSLAANNRLCQVSGIATTGNINIAITYAENFPAQARQNYLFDGRRALDALTDDGTGAFLFNNGQGNTSNWSNNGALTGSSGSLLNTSRIGNDVVSFDTVAQPNGVIAIGAKFDATESLANVAISRIVITDANGPHVIDMSVSNGNSSQFTSTDGMLTIRLFNFSGTSHWVEYQQNVARVGLGWAGRQQFATLRQWYDSNRNQAAHQTALCRGDLGATSVSVATADFPGGALIRTDGVQYDGRNHAQLALLRNPLVIASTSTTIAQDLFIQSGTSTLYSAVVGSANCRLLRCYVENTAATIGTNGGVISAHTGGIAENCVGRATLSTVSRALRPSGAGVLLNCIGIGGANAIQSEWSNTRSERCYAVGSSGTSYLWNNGRPPANVNNASHDASGDTGFQNLDPALHFVDYANADYRIRVDSPLRAANIGAFFEPGGSGVQPERHTGAALILADADIIAGGQVAQRERFTGAAIVDDALDFVADGAVMQRERFSSGTLLQLQPDFISAGGFSQREWYSGGALVQTSAQWTAGGQFAQRERYTSAAILAAAVDFTVMGSVNQRERHSSNALLQIAAQWSVNGQFTQRERYASGATLIAQAQFIAGGYSQSGENHAGSALLAVGATFIAGGQVKERERIVSGAMLQSSADFIAYGAIQQKESYVAPALIAIGTDFICQGSFNQRERYMGGAIAAFAADYVAGGAAVQRERYSGSALIVSGARFVADGFDNSGQHVTGNALLHVAPAWLVSATAVQRERFVAGAIAGASADVVVSATVVQRERISSGALLQLEPVFIAAGGSSQRERYTGAAILTASADFIASGFDNSGQHVVSPVLLNVKVSPISAGAVIQKERFTGAALIKTQPGFSVDAVLRYSQHIQSAALMPIACDFIVSGQYNQQFNYVGGTVLQANADFITGGKIFQAIKKLRHSGHYVWNKQTKEDQREYVRQSPDSFTGLLYVVRDAAQSAPAADDWRDDALFAQPDVNQRVTEYADPVVCFILERPRESMPFDMDMAGNNLINEHEDYLTVCVDTDVPTGSALEFEDDLGGGQTRRSWWYVHHSTSLGTTTAGAVYYLIPLRDFTGIH